MAETRRHLSLEVQGDKNKEKKERSPEVNWKRIRNIVAALSVLVGGGAYFVEKSDVDPNSDRKSTTETVEGLRLEGDHIRFIRHPAGSQTGEVWKIDIDIPFKIGAEVINHEVPKLSSASSSVIREAMTRLEENAQAADIEIFRNQKKFEQGHADAKVSLSRSHSGAMGVPEIQVTQYDSDGNIVDKGTLSIDQFERSNSGLRGPLSPDKKFDWERKK